jgi:hypothetical protein
MCARAPVDGRIQRDQGTVGDDRREIKGRVMEPIGLDFLAPGHVPRITPVLIERKT